MANSQAVEPTRRDFLYIATGTFGAVGAALASWPFISQMNPSASVLALASIEVDIASVQPGQAITVMWRGKPVFIRRRTPKEIQEAETVPVSDLIDPIARNANFAPDAQATDDNRLTPNVGSATQRQAVPQQQAPANPSAPQANAPAQPQNTSQGSTPSPGAPSATAPAQPSPQAQPSTNAPAAGNPAEPAPLPAPAIAPAPVNAISPSTAPANAQQQTEPSTNAASQPTTATTSPAAQPALAETKNAPGENKKLKPEWLVVVGVCTHLGCIPLGYQGAWGGWLCPCHGSQYDTAGRVRRGPAPENLAIPPYTFLSDTRIRIG